MPQQTAETILTELRRAPLLRPDQMTRVEEAVRKGNLSPERLARWLGSSAGLTEFQIEAVLGGRAEKLAFGPYLLIEKLGEGGMGVVYKARHRHLGRVDAVKVMRADKVASKVIGRRFMREIRLTARLDHPHIVRAHDAGAVGKQLYLATEFVEGEDLAATVARQGALSVAEACLAVYQTALALEHIHTRGLIHRDIKPSNLLRSDSTKSIKLLDLGLSGVYGRSEGSSINGPLTHQGVLLGTPDFMAPEQIRDPHGVDIRADLYSLGCTFHFLLTARSPYEGSTVDKLQQHVSAPPPQLQLPGGYGSAELGAFINKLMAKEPAERYQTPRELIGALLALRPGHQRPVAGAPVPVQSAVSTVPDPEPWRTQFDELVSRDESFAGTDPVPARQVQPASTRWWLVGSVVAALLVVVLGVVLVRYAGRSRQTAATPPASPTADEPNTDELRTLQRAVQDSTEDREAVRLRVIDFRRKHAGRPPAVQAARLLRRLPSPLDRLTPQPDPATGTPAVTLPREPAGRAAAVWVGFTPADDRLLVVRFGHPPEEWDPIAVRETGRLDGLAVAGGNASLTPDGFRAVGIDVDGALSIVRGSGRPRPLTIGPGQAVRVAGVAPDGQSAVVAFQDGEQPLAAVDLATGKLLTRLDQLSVGVTSATVSPDGAHCLVAGEDGAVRVFSLVSGKPVQAFEPAAERRVVAAFGPDGQRVYALGTSAGAARFPLGGKPDLYYAASDEADDVRRPKKWRVRPAEPTCLAVSADETTVVFGGPGGNVRVFATSTGKPMQEFRLNSQVRAVAFSTHGRVLAVALDDGSVRLVSLKG